MGERLIGQRPSPNAISHRIVTERPLTPLRGCNAMQSTYTLHGTRSSDSYGVINRSIAPSQCELRSPSLHIGPYQNSSALRDVQFAQQLEDAYSLPSVVRV